MSHKLMLYQGKAETILYAAYEDNNF